MIKISVPNDDHVALRAIAKALEEIAVARGAPAQALNIKHYLHVSSDDEALGRLHQATSDLMRAAPAMMRENDVDGSIEIYGERKYPGDKLKIIDECPPINTQPSHFATAEQLEKINEALRNAGVSEDTPVDSVLMTEPPTTDSTDTPWDERIHSASKALNADGTWRLRRKPKDMNNDEWELEVQGVRDELSGEKNEDALQPPLYGVSPGHIGVMQPEPPVTPPGDDFHVDTGVVTEQQVADIPPPPPVPVNKVVSTYQGADGGQHDIITLGGSQTPVMTFPQVMAYLTERHGRISNAQVEQIIAEMGLKSIMDLNTQPEHTGPFIARVKALLGE